MPIVLSIIMIVSAPGEPRRLHGREIHQKIVEKTLLFPVRLPLKGEVSTTQLSGTVGGRQTPKLCELGKRHSQSLLQRSLQEVPPRHRGLAATLCDVEFGFSVLMPSSLRTDLIR